MQGRRLAKEEWRYGKLACVDVANAFATFESVFEGEAGAGGGGGGGGGEYVDVMGAAVNIADLVGSMALGAHVLGGRRMSPPPRGGGCLKPRRGSAWPTKMGLSAAQGSLGAMSANYSLCQCEWPEKRLFSSYCMTTSEACPQAETGTLQSL